MLKLFFLLNILILVSAQSTADPEATGFSGGSTTLDPSTVDLSTRQSWCVSETNACPELCPGAETSANDCNADSLTYTCTCSNGTSPDLNAYTNTLPYFMCEELLAQCININQDDSDAQQKCSGRFICGTLDPADAAISVPSQPPDGESSQLASNTGSGSTSTDASSTDAPSPTSTHSTPTSSKPSATRPRSSMSSWTNTSWMTYPPTGSPTPTTTPHKSGLSSGAIAGIAVGVGIPLIGIAGFIAYRFGRRKNGAEEYPDMPTAPPHMTQNWSGGNEVFNAGREPGIGYDHGVGGIQGGYSR